MLLSAVSVLVVAQSSSEIPEGLMNNPVYMSDKIVTMQYKPKDDQGRDGGSNFILRINEQKTRLTLHEHDDHDDDCNDLVTNLAPSVISFYDILQPEFSNTLQLK